jgi:two-component system response regulator FixJ
MMEMTQVTARCEVRRAAQVMRRVYVIDDDSDVRKSLHFLLAASSVVAWPFALAADFLDQLPTLEPAPVLLDIRMPGIDGVEMLALVREREIRWPVVMMSAHGDVPVAVRAMKLGAVEFLEKPFQPGILDRAMDHAFAVLDRMAPARRDRHHARHLIGLLSPREREIMTILIDGAANKAAAHRLGLSARTVEMHRRNAFAKLKLKNIAEAVALFIKAELSH